jgi:hypothetical protein
MVTEAELERDRFTLTEREKAAGLAGVAQARRSLRDARRPEPPPADEDGER